MSSLFRRQTAISCFFCQSPIHPMPPNPRSFKCPSCTCWNRYDARGEITSDEPAMHDETLNAQSFAKRASPNKNHLPSSYNRGPFCHTCQTNQTLLVNLLSNYLPPPEDPTYERRLATLPAYTSSLQTRYPPVCPDCLPAVEEEIQRKNHMARTQALGGVLKESKGKDKERISEQVLSKHKLYKELLMWRVRGCLWLSGLLGAIGGSAAGAFGLHPPKTVCRAAPVLPILALISVAWTFWDPTYSLSRRSRQQGREVRIAGRSTYIKLQLISWLCRLTTAVLIFFSWLRPDWDPLQLLVVSNSPAVGESNPRKIIWFGTCLALELAVLISSYFSIRIHQPPSVRLVDTTVHLTPAYPSHPQTSQPGSRATSPPPLPVPSEPDLFATLSLSSNPIISNYAINPIFGRPSLHAAAPPTTPGADVNRDPDAMDWEPSSSALPDGFKSKRTNADPDDDHDDDGGGVILRPQRFFAPEQPTGLEGLLMRTRLMDDDVKPGPTSPRGPESRRKVPCWNWVWVYAMSCIPIALLAGILWNRRHDMG